MEERKYGEVFRELRQSKGYTLKQVSEGIATHSYLSKFERGECEISIRNFFAFLERLNTSWVEYASFFEKNDSDGHLLLGNIDRFLQKNDIQALKNLVRQEEERFRKTKAKSHRLNKLMVQAVISTFDAEEVITTRDLDFLKETLMEDESWGLYELRLFAVTLHLLPMEVTLSFVKEIFKKLKKYLDQTEDYSKERKQVMITTIHNVVVFCINHKEYSLAKTLLEELKIRLLADNLYYNALHQQFYQGIVEERLGDLQEGKIKIQKALIAFEIIDPKRARVYKQYIQEEGLGGTYEK